MRPTRGRWDTTDLPACRDRIVERVRLERTGCWKWLGTIAGGTGYGQVSVTDGLRHRTSSGAHRFSYEMFNGVSVLPGYDIDHLCRNPRCVNPSHLEPVTRRENVLRSPITAPGINARKTHCPKGHEYTPENTYLSNGTWRRCRTCILDRRRAKYLQTYTGGAA